MSEHKAKPITYDIKKVEEAIKKIEIEKNNNQNYYTIDKNEQNRDKIYKPTFKYG